MKLSVMERISRHVAGAALLVLFVALSGSWHVSGAEPLTVITTVFPLKEFAQAVGGDKTVVNLLLPPGAEPHTWEPRPSDMVALTHADVFIYISDEMEPWVPDVLNSLDNRTIKVVETAQGLPVRTAPADHGHAEAHRRGSGRPGRDPHIWLNFQYDQQIIDVIAQTLSTIDPPAAPFYEANARIYKERLHRLDQRYQQELGTCAQRTFVLGGHAAFGYLADRYGLEQISLYGLSPNAEPTPRQMAEFISLVKKYQSKVIFFEPLVSERMAKAIAREVGAQMLVLSPGANVTRAEMQAETTFLQLMERNLEHLKYGLGCR